MTGEREKLNRGTKAEKPSKLAPKETRSEIKPSDKRPNWWHNRTPRRKKDERERERQREREKGKKGRRKRRKKK